MSIPYTIQQWSWDTHDLIVVIPPLVGQIWEMVYGVKLKGHHCVQAKSLVDDTNFYGERPKLYLARDLDDHYLLIKAKENWYPAMVEY